MELGATVCVRHKPLCLTCPVQRFCTAAQRGEPDAFPRLAPKLMEQRVVTRVWCVHDQALLLHRAAVGARRLAELHELPAAEHLRRAEKSFAPGDLLATRRRTITRFQITENIY